MTATYDSDGHVQYHSRGGRVAFGVWCLVILAGVIGAAVSAAVTGEPPWIFVAAAAGLLALGIHATSLEVVLASNGELTFRGLVRRRTWPVADLRIVRPESFCIVFKFEEGGAMVASSNADDWLDLCRRIKRLNPGVTLNMPGMFRLPFEPDDDAES